ncbi:hypothetical protein ACFOGI_09650 [Virgibacillus xinjiangensis]|uniref:Uncharacterized protein n=1 Tax=Virgibacillus xinjiangensis TaxID=393090 RepID=A0ABV7CW17_9BACI
MAESTQGSEKGDLLLQAARTQSSILRLLETTMMETYQYEKSLPKDEQNEELIHLAERARTIIAKKPKLKEIHRKLEEEHSIKL